MTDLPAPVVDDSAPAGVRPKRWALLVRCARRRPRLTALAGLVTLCLLATLLWVAVPSHLTTTVRVDDTAMTVTAPRQAGEVTVTSHGTPTGGALPRGVVPLTSDFDISANPFNGLARLDFQIPGLSAKIPDQCWACVAVFTFHEPSAAWLHVGGVLDSANDTISLDTPHFSHYLVGLYHADTLRGLQEQFAKTGTSWVDKVKDGVNPAPNLSCNADRPLIAARVSAPLAQSTDLCQDLRSADNHHLSFFNRSAMAFEFSLPAGYAVEPLADDKLSLEGYLARARPQAAGMVSVAPGESLDLAFTQETAATAPRLEGSIDWVTSLSIAWMRVAMPLVASQEMKFVGGSLMKASTAFTDLTHCVAEQRQQVLGAAAKQGSLGDVLGIFAMKVLADCGTKIWSAVTAVTAVVADIDPQDPAVDANTASRKPGFFGKVKDFFDQKLFGKLPGRVKEYSKAMLGEAKVPLLLIPKAPDIVMSMAQVGQMLAHSSLVAFTSNARVAVIEPGVLETEFSPARWKSDVLEPHLRCTEKGLALGSQDTHTWTMADLTGDALAERLVSARCTATTSAHSWVTFVVDGRSTVAPGGWRVLPALGGATMAEDFMTLEVRTHAGKVTLTGESRSTNAALCCADQTLTMTATLTPAGQWETTRTTAPIANASQPPGSQPSTANGANGAQAFRTPSGNIQCYTELNPGMVTCRILDRSWGRNPATPYHPSGPCGAVGDGPEILVISRSWSSFSCGTDFDGEATVPNQASWPVLPFGSSITHDGITCTANEAGLTCTSPGASFLLSKGRFERTGPIG